MFNYYRMFQKGMAFILIPPILLGLIAFGITKLWIAPTYEAGISLVIENRAVENTSRYEDIMASQALAKGLIIIAQSTEIKRDVIAAVGDTSLNADYLTQNATIELINSTNVMSIAVKDTNPVRVAKLAQMYAETLMKRGPEYVKNANILVLDQAVVPQDPSGPNMLLNVAAGVMLGFIGGLTAAFIAEFRRENNPKYAR